MPRGNFISLQQAIDMTTRYRNSRNKVLAPEYQNILPVCETFDKALVQTVLNQNNCVGFRVYFAMDEDHLVKAVLVGVDGEGADILPASQEADNESLLEEGQRCPEICPPASPLNG